MEAEPGLKGSVGEQSGCCASRRRQRLIMDGRLRRIGPSLGAAEPGGSAPAGPCCRRMTGWRTMEDAIAPRVAMVKRLKRSGVVRTESVERALREIPRHVFIAHVPVDAAYADHAVILKRAGDGTAISSASQPTMVAIMLEHLQVANGHRVLEVGTGSGYNAALLSVLVGATGSVVSVELEADLADHAENHLAAVGARRIEVVTGDGGHGYPPRSPYDRVIVTAGARAVEEPWKQQLVGGGRLVVPIVDERGIGSVVAFDKVGGDLVRGPETACGFLPMRHPPST